MKKMIVILLAGMFAATLSARGLGQTDGAKNKTATPKEIAAQEAQLLDETKNPKLEETEAERKERIISNVFCYVPNRVMDFLDMTSLNLKGGTYFGLGFQITKYFGLGAQYGANAGLYKDVNRQYGIAFEKGYQAQCLFLTMEDVSVTDPIGTVKEYWRHGSNFPEEDAKIYTIGSGARDYWAIEVYAYFLAGVKIAIHPIEVADFFTGLVCHDLVGDDIKLERY